MSDLARRAEGYEYMDEATPVGPDLEQCLRELVRVNRFLGGVDGTLGALESLAGEARSLTVLDLGAGAADVPRAMVGWAKGRGIEMRVTAVDFNPAIVTWAREELADVAEIEVREQDALALPYADDSFDLVHAGLFLHHFSGERLQELLRTMYRLGRRGLIVNDLHRHALAYGAIRLFDALFSRSEMAKHDGPQSVKRGFQRDELMALGRECGIEFDLRWRWAFRWVATAVK